jgi:anti-anti-sigma factor
MIDPDSTVKAACFKLAGEWDFARREELQAILRPAESLEEVLLDFSEVTFMDACALGCFLRLRRSMIERRRFSNIRIIAASRAVIRLFEICQLQELFGLPSTTIKIAVGNELAKMPMIRGSAFISA